MQARGRVKVVFIGWGAIGSRVGDLLAKREAPVEIAGIATIDEPAARAALPRDIPFIGDPARLKSEALLRAYGLVARFILAPGGEAELAALVDRARAAAPCRGHRSRTAPRHKCPHPRALARLRQNRQFPQAPPPRGRGWSPPR